MPTPHYPALDLKGSEAGAVPQRQRLRPEIQGLRAIAVLLVVGYHLYPNRLSGGFVGVDVFFVISGFLITAHLAAQIAKTGSLSLTDFWGRRMRRLLPASFLVLSVSSLLTWLVVPQTLWDQTIRQIIASALYVQNWALAADAIDYSAAGNTPTLVQHYWSLSVEEQFYLVWPLLALAVVVALGRLRRSAHIGAGLVIVIGLLTAVSFAYSVYLTDVDPGRAYFVTGTRAWEFGIGSLLALTMVHGVQNVRARLIAGWVGVAAILYAGFTYTSATPFPGWQAAIPVIGTALVIAAGGALTGSAAQLLSLRPATFIGDISYAVYLWHWPLIICVPYLLATDGEPVRQLGHSGALGVFIATILLSWASTRWIEDPMRTNAWLSRNFATTLIAATTSMAVLIAVGLLLRADLDRQVAAADQSLAEALEDTVSVAPGSEPTGCVGPAALTPANNCSSVAGSGPLLARPAVVARQNTDVVFPDCQSQLAVDEMNSCELGATGNKSSPSPDETVALVGDSHSTHWFSAFDALGKQRGWKVVTYTRSSCPFTAAVRVVPEEPKDYLGFCMKANAEVLDRLISDPTISKVFTSSFSSAYTWESPRGAESQLTGDKALEAGIKKYADALAAAGKELIVIRDVPAVKDLKNSTDCLAAVEDVRDCGLPREKGLTRDAYAEVAGGLGLPVIDLTPQFCDSEWCHAVVGDVIVYRDYSHLSAEYSTMLAPYLDLALTAQG